MAMEAKPPRWALTILRFYADESVQEEIEGDLNELFYGRLEHRGPWQARLLYGWDVLRSIPLARLSRKPTGQTPVSRTPMLSSYLTIAWCSLMHNKSVSLLNSLGLALGLVGLLATNFSDGWYSPSGWPHRWPDGA